MKYFDRVWETTTTTGTGSYTLDGAKSAAYRAFGDVLADNDYVEYFVRDSDASNWERVWGQYDAGNNTLTRNLIESSTGSLIDWGSGTKEVYIAPPAASLNDISGIYVGTSRPAWLPANSLWIKPSTSTLYWYDGTGDREMGLVSGGSFIAKTSAKLESIQCIVVPAGVAVKAVTGAFTFYMPYDFTVTAVYADLVTAQASGNIVTVDINEAGTSILSTKLTVDNTETSSRTAAAPAVISDASIAAGAKMTIDVDQIGDGSAKGLVVTLVGYQS